MKDDVAAESLLVDAIVANWMTGIQPMRNCGGRSLVAYA
jgi:hypothetical protein